MFQDALGLSGHLERLNNEYPASFKEQRGIWWRRKEEFCWKLESNWIKCCKTDWLVELKQLRRSWKAAALNSSSGKHQSKEEPSAPSKVFGLTQWGEQIDAFQHVEELITCWVIRNYGGYSLLFKCSQFSRGLSPSVSRLIPLRCLWHFDVSIFTPCQFRAQSDLFLSQSLLSHGLSLFPLSICVIVWYGKNVAHAEAAAATATTHSSVYGQLTSGLSDFEQQGHQAHSPLFTNIYLYYGLRRNALLVTQCS